MNQTNLGRVLVAMSGGVDSSVAALLLKRQGFDCLGATMRLLPVADGAAPTDTDAEMVARALGIPYTLLDFSADFRACVMDYFVRTYETGGTPNPCVECNRTMKFGRLAEAGRALGCERIATGHYARITHDAGGRWLLSGAEDDSKDQTYVLWSLSQEQLSRTLFPLGEFKKSEIRELALENGFCNAQRKDSQDICFIPDGDYAGFLSRYTGKHFPEGDFTDLEGNLLGRHRGIVHYTVGQRKGLGLAFGKPTYVCAIDPARNTVVLGDNEALFRRELNAHALNLIAVERLDVPLRVQAKIRYQAKPASAVAEQTGEQTLRLTFDEPQRAITPGQSVVLYDGKTVIGGGIID